MIKTSFRNKKVWTNSYKLSPKSSFSILLSFDCHSTKNEPRNAVNSAFLGSCTLFKLNRSRWFTGQVIHYPVDTLHFVYNSCHYLLENFKRYVGAVGGHEIAGVYCS